MIERSIGTVRLIANGSEDVFLEVGFHWDYSLEEEVWLKVFNDAEELEPIVQGLPQNRYMVDVEADTKNDNGFSGNRHNSVSRTLTGLCGI